MPLSVLFEVTGVAAVTPESGEDSPELAEALAAVPEERASVAVIRKYACNHVVWTVRY